MAMPTLAQSTSGLATPATTDQLIVRLRTVSQALPDLTGLPLLMSGAVLPLKPLRQLHDGAWVVGLPQPLSGAQIQNLTAQLKRLQPVIASVEPDLRMRALGIPNDPLFNQQWSYFDATGGIRLPQAHELSTGRGVTVAVLDTGVRPHADLRANLVAGYDFVSDARAGQDGNGRDADPQDPGDGHGVGACPGEPLGASSSWHGTHVSGTIAAVTNNGVGVAGVAPGAKVQPVRVLGRCGGYLSDVVDGMVWAVGGTVRGVPVNRTPAQVLNLSLGGTGACSATLQKAIDVVRAARATLVVAAGNEGGSAANASPANCRGVVAVAATTLQGGRASYSNTGPNVTLAAPGGDSGMGILSTLNAGSQSPGADSYGQYIGTSMAAPHVSGVVALMLSLQPGWGPSQVQDTLTRTARAFPAPCGQCGSGLVDAWAAVKAAASSQAPTPPSASAPPAVPQDPGTPMSSPAPEPTPTAVSVVEVEPNNTLAAAQRLPQLPADVEGSLSGTDTDWFQAWVPARGRLVATLTSSVGTQFDLEARDGSGRLLASSALGAGATDTVTVTNGSGAPAAAYFRVVRGAVLLFSSPPGTYVLSITP